MPNPGERAEIVASMADGRDFTERERLTFGLDEMALNIRHWLAYTKAQRDREGLPIDGCSDVHFPIAPSYPQLERWAETMEQAAVLMRAPPRVIVPAGFEFDPAWAPPGHIVWVKKEGE